MVKILISGLLVYDSGKTWLSISLLKRLREYGYRIGVYKPVAGHNAWMQYKTLVISRRLGILIGEDVFNYIDILGIDREKIILINPIDILLAPPEITNYTKNMRLEEYLIDLENQYKQMVLGRISDCSTRSSIHYIFQENFDNIALSLRNKILELSKLLDARKLALYSFLNMITDKSIEKNLNICLETISKDSDIVIIESFNDAVTPYLSLLEDIDRVIIVVPGALMVYGDASKIYSILKKKVEKHGNRGFKSVYIVNELHPDAVISVEPREDIGTLRSNETLDQILSYIVK